MKALYELVSSRAGHRCEYCRAPEAAFNVAFEVEHVIPRFHGGPSDETNCALGCRSCNQFKATAMHAVDPLTLESVRLFNPRTDEWKDHFDIDRDGGISGLSAIGRATVGRLKMNSPRQLAARRLWIVLHIFP